MCWYLLVIRLCSVHVCCAVDQPCAVQCYSITKDHCNIPGHPPLFTPVVPWNDSRNNKTAKGHQDRIVPAAETCSEGQCVHQYFYGSSRKRTSESTDVMQ